MVSGMPSVRDFVLPDLGEGLLEAEIVRWLVADGDPVAVDQPVVEVETAKAVVELPCPYAGVVSHVYGGEGDVLAVGHPVIAVRVEESADLPGPAADEALPAGGSGSVLVGYGTRETPRRPGASAARLGSRPAAVSAAAANPGPIPVISPLVRQLARRHGLDLRTVTGTGSDGLILRCDVDAAIHRKEEEAVPGAHVGVRVPLRGRRAAAAAQFTRSRREIPDATCWVEADATALVEARVVLAAQGAPRSGCSPCWPGSVSQASPGTRSSTRASTPSGGDHPMAAGAPGLRCAVGPGADRPRGAGRAPDGHGAAGRMNSPG